MGASVARALPFRVLVITDEVSARRAGRGVVETIARALGPSARGTAVLVRAKAQPVDEVRGLCAALLPIARRAGALLLVHTHAALVGELGLDGAHLDGTADVQDARTRLPAGALLGASRHASDVGASLD